MITTMEKMRILSFCALKQGAEPVFVYPESGVLADNPWYHREACQFIVDDFGIDLDKSRGVYEYGMPRKTEMRQRSFAEKCIEVVKGLI